MYLSQGFTNIEIESTSNCFRVSATKPEYEVGSKSKLSFKKSDKPKDMSWLTAKADDVELEDEDALLDDEDMKKPEVPTLDNGQPKKKKACKDCSCGLKEIEEEEKKGQAEVITVQPKSSCGSVCCP